ncbi:hypothetical protein [Halobacillus seohaensis]|uniref:Helix-turn-helix domain-containing protein n=1 Tax=Halobacillus seohaensis TaxID=447421 RepID=A0ABW2ES33_9BACI
MTQYNVDQALEKLKHYKITTHKESLRRWLRNGTLKGMAPTSRKEGWRINESDLWAFIQERVPEELVESTNATNVVKDNNDRESVRAEMWWEMVRKNMFEGSMDVKKMDIKACIEHNKHSKDFEAYVWEKINEHTWQAKPRILYLLDAFLFNGHRIKMDHSFEELEEQILFPLIEYLRRKRTNK